MADQTGDTVLFTVLVSLTFIAAPIFVGFAITPIGSGRFVWVTALAALALTVAGLRYATAIYTPEYDLDALFGIFLSALGLLIGLGSCTVALFRSWDERRGIWLVVLAMAAALPLLAATPIFDYGFLAPIPAYPGTSVYPQFRAIAVWLPPFGCAVLLAYGFWSAWVRHRPRVGTA
jgi:hypothetical protein